MRRTIRYLSLIAAAAEYGELEEETDPEPEDEN